jgi:hypothetical protein
MGVSDMNHLIPLIGDKVRLRIQGKGVGGKTGDRQTATA